MAEPIVATKQVIEEMFDGAAARYDREGSSIFWQFGARLVELLEIAPGARVLDVATGKGAVLIPLAQRVGAKGHVIGVDLSHAMVEEAARAARETGSSNFETRKMDAEHLEFAPASFDAVTCAFALFFFPAMDVALREMRRVLKPGGRIGLTLFGGKPPPFDPGWKMFAEQARAYDTAVRTPQRVAYSPEQVQSLLTTAGFAQVNPRLETYDIVFATEENWWAFQFTLVNRAAILRLSEETRARFKEEHLAKVRPLFRTDGLHLGVSVIYAMARAG
jgi:O-methyltransferase/aklanonic acid methyltransferase